VCVEEFPQLSKLHEKYGPQGAAFLGVSVDEAVKAADRAIKKHKLPWPQVADGKGFAGEFAQKYRVEGTPSFYVLDRAGRIFARPESAQKLEAVLVEALAWPVDGPPRQARDAWQRPLEVLDRLGVKPGSLVADIGSGEGYFTAHLAARVGAAGKVYAGDIDDAALAKLRERAQKEGWTQVEAVRGSEDDPRLPADSLDAALIVDAYHEFRQFDAMLAAIARALKPGGRLGILDKTAAMRLPRTDYHTRHEIPAELVIEEVARHGLRLKWFAGDFARHTAGDNYDYLIIFEKPRPN